MNLINFLVGVAGLILGLVSAWPRLVEWTRRFRGFNEDRKQRSRAQLAWIQRQVADSASFFLAQLGVRVLGIVGLLPFSTAMGKVAAIGGLPLWMSQAAYTMQTISGLIVGWLFGTAMGLCISVIRTFEQRRP